MVSESLERLAGSLVVGEFRSVKSPSKIAWADTVEEVRLCFCRGAVRNKDRYCPGKRSILCCGQNQARNGSHRSVIGKVLTQIRNQALDIDAAATNHAVQTQTSQAKNLAVKALAQHLVECLRQKILVETDHESQARIRELEGQLGDLQQQYQRHKNSALAPAHTNSSPGHQFACQTFLTLAARRKVRGHVNTHAFASTNRSWRISLCRAWVSIPVSERATADLLRGREQALIKLCSLLSMFLSLLDGFVLAKAFSDFGGRNGGSRRCNMPLPSLVAYQLRCMPFSTNRHSKQKRPRGSSLLSSGATHCSILKQQSASAAMSSVSQRSARCTGWQNTCQHTWHRGMKGHYQRLAIPGPPGALP